MKSGKKLEKKSKKTLKKKSVPLLFLATDGGNDNVTKYRRLAERKGIAVIDTYTKDYNELMKDYNEGNVQQCVKVEAETVYHNLNKVLNSIKDLLDE